VIVVSDEVRAADAVVALETTLVAHGFPAGEGLEVGLAAERSVRAAGAVPATVGVLGGEIRVGLSEDELARFDASARKAGPRDLAACVVQGAIGATTVGGTLAVCRAVGIRFMGTGGLGGVHRGFPDPPDVSADLGELARAKALVVCAGIKSLLDVPAPCSGSARILCRCSTRRTAARRSRRAWTPLRRPHGSRRRTGSWVAAGSC
jgi:pseudouridine-5'-phosphate glycosidase